MALEYKDLIKLQSKYAVLKLNLLFFFPNMKGINTLWLNLIYTIVKLIFNYKAVNESSWDIKCSMLELP